MWRCGWAPCPSCCYPYQVLAVWTGAQGSCIACGALLRPGRVVRVTQGGETVDLVTCPWCGAEQRWSALERVGLPERRERVHYSCPECLRPFVAEHDPTVVGTLALSELSQRELGWLAFVRALLSRGVLQP